MSPLLIYTTALTPRLDYIAKFLFKQVLQVPYVFTTSQAKAQSAEGWFINYSAQSLSNGIQIMPTELLFQKNITPQAIEMSTWRELPVFFCNDAPVIPFDIFAASFYLVARYEEYLPHEQDEYQRFSHKASMAHQHNFLHLPLVNMWAAQLLSILQIHGIVAEKTIALCKRVFTIDVDHISAYKHKGFFHSIGGLAKNIFQPTEFLQRLKVLIGAAPDPFDTLHFLLEQAKEIEHKKVFFLTLLSQSRYDKNILATHKAFAQAVQKTMPHASIGIHPSYNSSEHTTLIVQEKNCLEKISQESIDCSRQHYIKFALPHTVQALVAAGIAHDYSMGYGSTNGFRASTCTPFFFYDVSAEKVLPITMHPFCWMDANCVYEQRLTPQQSFAEWQQYYHACLHHNGEYIDIWHNFILRSDSEGSEWREVYEQLIKIG